MNVPIEVDVDLTVSHHTWVGLTTAASDDIESADTGTTKSHVSLVLDGIFNAATVVILGSHDGTYFAPLRDKFGTALSLTSAAAVELPTTFQYIKPIITGGTDDNLTLVLGVCK